ncbi:MAG: RNA polymerase sigma factor [Syntrophobacterales bacterium]|jgi:RNA polymerase sigma-70 factor, ECF subfamily
MLDSSQSMERFLASVERRAFRMAQIATNSTDDALDIVQEAMLSLVKRYGAKPEEEWKPLFYRILVNSIRDWYRRTRVRSRWRSWLQTIHKADDADASDPIESFPDPAGHNPEDQVIIGDSLAALDTALRTLPPRQQQAFLLRAWEGLSVGETAVAMRCSSGSVKTHYARAVRTLRKLLEDHWP